MAKQDSDNTTHFGYQDVAAEDKANMVRGVFDSVASRYDIMNDLMSAGLHRLWKRHTIDQAAARPGHHVLDLAGGTGDIAFRIAERSPGARVTVADINAEMMRVGRDRLLDEGLTQVSFCQANGEHLPFPDSSMDAVTAFHMLYDVDDLDATLGELRRVLAPRGALHATTNGARHLAEFREALYGDRLAEAYAEMLHRRARREVGR